MTSTAYYSELLLGLISQYDGASAQRKLRLSKGFKI